MTDALTPFLTPDQLDLLARKLGQVFEDGFGEVHIIVRKREVRFIRVTSSYEVSNGDLQEEES